jgi:hypothetical protein
VESQRPERGGRGGHGHREHGEDSDDSHSHSESGSCEHCHHNYQYVCNDLEWVQYLLDDAPAEYGVYMGDSSPGTPAYAGYGVFESELGTVIDTGRIQVTHPKGMVAARLPGYFSNDTCNIFYLKNDCEKYQFEWVISKPGEIIPYGVEPLRPMANGFRNYIARKRISDQKIVFGNGLPGKASFYYVDDTQAYPNQVGTSNSDFEVLTCKAKKCEFYDEFQKVRTCLINFFLLKFVRLNQLHHHRPQRLPIL